MHMFYGSGYYMGGMHGLWWLFWLVVVGALVYFGWGRASDARRTGETANEILDRRLAAGEISPEEYEQRRSLIQRGGSGRS